MVPAIERYNLLPAPVMTCLLSVLGCTLIILFSMVTRTNGCRAIFSKPFGPLADNSVPWILTSTPAGIATGFLPILEVVMTSPTQPYTILHRPLFAREQFCPSSPLLGLIQSQYLNPHAPMVTYCSLDRHAVLVY